MSNQGFDFGQVGCNSFAVAQQNANASRAQNNIVAHREPMTPADLGIVDQLLDDKVGMEP